MSIFFFNSKNNVGPTFQPVISFLGKVVCFMGRDPPIILKSESIVPFCYILGVFLWLDRTFSSLECLCWLLGLNTVVGRSVRQEAVSAAVRILTRLSVVNIHPIPGSSAPPIIMLVCALAEKPQISSEV